MTARFEIRRSRKRLKQRWYVATVGDNGRVLQTSELLSSRDDCLTNIAALRSVVHDGAEIVDRTA